MKTIASRELAARPGQVWRLLARERSLIVTKDGVPRGIMVPTDESTLVEDVQDLVFARARRAVSAIRADAARSGRNRMTPAEIDAEIQQVRKARKPRTARG